jgi:hypothetical protein
MRNRYLPVLCCAFLACSPEGESVPAGDGDSTAEDQQDRSSPRPDGEAPPEVAPPCETGADCDDQNACTEDTCLPIGTCAHVPLPETPCNDGDQCTPDDRCDTTGSCVGTGMLACDDYNGCTANACSPTAGCEYPPEKDGLPCSDGDICTVDDACVAGTCVGLSALCEDGNDCTADACDFGTGMCTYVPQSNLPCDDQNACTIQDMCNAGVCTPGKALECDDQEFCTQDQCLPLSREQGGGCQHFPAVGLDCDDGNPCTEWDLCTEEGACKGTALDCADDNPCTDDLCDFQNGCHHLPNTGNPCDDQDPCTGTGKCLDGVCQPGPGDGCDDGLECTVDTCTPEGKCLHEPDHALCLDDLFCNGEESCDVKLGCLAGAPPEESDSVACTKDPCNEELDSILHVPDNGYCSDGDECNGVEKCSLTEGCLKGIPLDCDDGDCCTLDGCHPLLGCQHEPPFKGCKTCASQADCHVPCQPGQPPDHPDTGMCEPDQDLCTDWTCDLAATGCGVGLGRCTPQTPPCKPVGLCQLSCCDPATGSQVIKASQKCCTVETDPPPGEGNPPKDPKKAVCDDDNPCTDDLCEYTFGQCYTQPTICSDGNACTADTCSWLQGGCVFAPLEGCKYNCYNNHDCRLDHGAAGDVGGLCTTETCSFDVDPLGSCLYEPLLCDDGLACSVDFCEDGAGCRHMPDPGCNGLACQHDDDCEDSHNCTNNACSKGKCVLFPIGCSDGDPCTLDWCSFQTGSCKHTTLPGCNADCVLSGPDLCDDADACTADQCDAGSGQCLHFFSSCHDGDPCTTDVCDPAIGCVFAPLPDCIGCLDEADCDDGNLCTEDLCLPPHPLSLLDEDYGQAGFLHEEGYCTHLPACTACTTDEPCLALMAEDHCIVSAACVKSGGYCQTVRKTCDDGDPCTSDGCDPATGDCVAASLPGCCTQDEDCDDGDLCTWETCDIAAMQCVPHPFFCDDYEACTEDSCQGGTCHHKALFPCYDECEKDIDCLYAADPKNFCVSPVCAADPKSGFGKCKYIWKECGDPYVCTEDSCSTPIGCQFLPAAICPAACGKNEDCHDADACTQDLCVDGTCTHSPPACDDNDACTADSCDRLTGQCGHVPCPGCNCALCETQDDCDDKSLCTVDTCPGELGAPQPCIHHAVVCNDGNPCTTDECLPASGCQFTPKALCKGCVENSDCEDGNGCSMDLCAPDHTCVQEMICGGEK